MSFLLPPACRLSAGSPGGTPSSPGDSGYGSNDDTHRGLVSNLSQYASDTELSPQHQNEVLVSEIGLPNSALEISLDGSDFQTSPVKTPKKQKLTSGLSSLDVSLFRRRPLLRPSITESTSSPITPGQSPDRFLPRRVSVDVVVHKFRTNKDPNMLTPVEKLLRHDSGAGIDVFGPRRRLQIPAPPIFTQESQGYSESHPGGPSALIFRREPDSPIGERQVSIGSAWTVGGLAPLSVGVSDGRGGLIGSGTNAPLYTTSFSSVVPRAQEDKERHEGRLAKALGIDRTRRVFDYADPFLSLSKSIRKKRTFEDMNKSTKWDGAKWVTNMPRAVLDAPNLRDDFYCSVLAYSPTCHTLAVGLGGLLYAWSEKQGVHLLNSGIGNLNSSWLTSVAFSSTLGQRCILAHGRSDGTLVLMSLLDRTLPRFEIKQPAAIACLTWRPRVITRQSRSPIHPGLNAETEDLIVGDEIGNVYYYSVEWPSSFEVHQYGWTGAVVLLARISIHSQQICGLAWSHDGSTFATGGNDNLCCLFRASRVLSTKPENLEDRYEEVIEGISGVRQAHTITGQNRVKAILSGSEKHRWTHGAAVKAIAFCPWRDSLVATGGGSNDKCIHFFHTISGACLATISVAAQVTSLIWSTTRREIAATFGYAQPEHPYRIAVFSWPECKQVAAIPWEGEHRALYAIAYPLEPNEKGRIGKPRTTSRDAQEGCIVVAASDESVKFHEVWSAGHKATSGGEGLLGGSDILEGLEGIDKEGDVIR